MKTSIDSPDGPDEFDYEQAIADYRNAHRSVMSQIAGSLASTLTFPRVRLFLGK